MDAEEIDQIVAKRIAAARRISGLTQTELGNKIGVTFQQVQKYENGTNRVSAGTLAVVAHETNRQVSWFFEETDAKVAVASDPMADFFSLPYAGKLAAAFAKVPRRRQASAIVELVRSIAEEG